MPEKPGHYTNGFGEPCNTFGGPLDCPFGNPNCLHGVTPGGGYACHDFRKDGFPVYAKIPNSNDYVLVHVHRKCHMRGRCKWCSKDNSEGHLHHTDPLFCAMCQRGDCPICQDEECAKMVCFLVYLCVSLYSVLYCVCLIYIYTHTYLLFSITF